MEPRDHGFPARNRSRFLPVATTGSGSFSNGVVTLIGMEPRRRFRFRERLLLRNGLRTPPRLDNIPFVLRIQEAAFFAKEESGRSGMRCFLPTIGIVLLTMVTVGVSAETGATSPKKPLPRAESFFGLHLDFHCSMTDQNVGANTTPEMVQTIIDRIQPDYIQIDCKGHPGVTSYPTKEGNPCPNIVGDPLRVWRDVTAEQGVALYMHYSGVWDSRACALHPEWAATDANGQRSPNMTSVFGPYVDRLLIPQLKELALDYQIDGVWIDGECWATIMDYGEISKQKFCEAYQVEESAIPTNPSDAHWYEWATFHRDAFRDYMRHYLAVMDEAAPQFQIASNWAFTDHMPEPICANVDFLSGDFTRTDSVNAARYSSRFMASQGKPWDLMAWSFAEPSANQPAEQKPAVQLQREAACVMSQGGGFQAYYTQNRDGSLNLDKIAAMAEVGPFVRARQPFCQYSTVIPQVTLLCPTESHYRRVSEQGGSLFPWTMSWQRGVLQCLLECGYPVSIVTEQNFAQEPTKYPVVVVCEWNWLSPQTIQTLKDYTENGGKLLVVGSETAKLFPSQTEMAVYAEPMTDTYRGGEVASNTEIRRQIRSLLRGIYADPIVVLDSDTDAVVPVDLSLMRTEDGKLAIHLTNVSGDHMSRGIIPEIAPLTDVKLTLRQETKPSRIVSQPGNHPVEFTWNATEKTAQVTVPEVNIHEILIVE